MSPKSPDDKSKSPLDPFLDGLEELTDQVIGSLKEGAEDADERAVVDAFAGALKEQIAGVTGFMRDGQKRMSRQQNVEAQRVLRISGGTTLLDGGKALSSNLASNTARLGMAGIFEELKKILEALLEIVGISLPSWFKKILNLIDEILNRILGARSAGLAAALSRQHQNYMNELIQLERLERESAWRYDVEDDEE